MANIDPDKLNRIVAAYDAIEERRDQAADARDEADRKGLPAFAEYDATKADLDAEAAELLDTLIQVIRHAART